MAKRTQRSRSTKDGADTARLENDPRFRERSEKARANIRAGRGMRLEDVALD